MTRFGKYAPLLVVLGLCFGFGVIFRSFLMTFVVQPIAVSLWLAWRLFATVDQNAYWILAVLICTVWMVRVLPPRGGKQRNQPDHDEQGPGTRIAYWQELLEAAQTTSSGNVALRSNMQELLASVVGRPEQYSPARLEKVLLLEHLELPPAAQRYLFPDRTRDSWLSAHYVRRALAHIRRWLPVRSREPIDHEASGISELLDVMESMMEINHDQQ